MIVLKAVSVKDPTWVELPKMDGRYDGDLLNFAAAIRGECEYGYSLEHDLVVQTCVLQASEML